MKLLLEILTSLIKCVLVGLTLAAIWMILCMVTEMESMVYDISRELSIQNVLWYRMTTLGKTQKVEENYLQASVQIINKDANSGGSGTVVKLNNKLYVLTCAHLIDKPTDRLIGTWTTKTAEVKRSLELVGMDAKLDLAIFKPRKLPKSFASVSLGKGSPTSGTVVDVIGNPGIHVNFASVGVTLCVTDKILHMTNTIGHGSSGGGVFYKGDLVGVIITMSYDGTSNAVALPTICKFLEKAVPKDYYTDLADSYLETIIYIGGKND